VEFAVFRADRIGANDRPGFLDAQRDAGAYERDAVAAMAVFDDIKDAAGAPDRVIDQLDELR
jgi:hypothetical protein